ncbi:hypothetical protein JCM10207_007812 [Rhodosporidiobolus poonsookiae]
MSQTAPKTGKTLVFARAVAKEGKADELEALLSAAIKNANSDNEPYTELYVCGRHGNEFRLAEKYDQDTGGIEEHMKQPPFQALVKSEVCAEVEILHFNQIF